MSTDPKTAMDDVAFLRSLVQAGEDNQRVFGEVYLWAGLIYGCEVLINAGQYLGLLPGGVLYSAAGIAPTAIFLAVLVAIIRRRRQPANAAVVSRAIGAIFGAIGIANLALIAVIGSVALRQASLMTWLIYPCAVFVLQGAAWAVSFALRRRPWHGVVALGWMATGVAMALSVTSVPAYMALAGVGLFVFMALPGYVMLRQSRLEQG